MSVANTLKNDGIGFLITDNDASKITTVVPPILLKTLKKIDDKVIKDLFNTDGRIAENKKDYENRQGQIEMSLAITKAFNENKIALIEAGTGIGKSLAYLIPAFIWTETNYERIIISTKTINLQNQIMQKDIPFVKKILNSSVNAVLIKGRRNYICKLKLRNMQSELDWDDEQEERSSILNWASITDTGDVDELNFIPDNNLWSRVASDSDFCAGKNCTFFKNCFLQQARRKAAESNIVVVNHHILFADINIKNGGNEENSLLPTYKRVIFDEAHNIDKSASSFFSFTFSKTGFYNLLKFFKTKKKKGILDKIVSKLSRSGSEYEELAEEFTDRIMGSFAFLYNESFDIFDSVNNYIEDLFDSNETYSFNDKIKLQYRIKKKEWESEKCKDNLIKPFKELLSFLEEFQESFTPVLAQFEKLSSIKKEKFDLDFKILKSFHNKLALYSSNLVSLLSVDLNKYVLWIDVYGDKESFTFSLIATPLYIDEIMKEKVFEVFDSTILTSATLTINQDFTYFKESVGLHHLNKEVITKYIESPFEYQKKVLFVVPADVPEPFGEGYNDNLNKFLKKSIEITKGSAFVLFTSYRQLKLSFEEVEPHLRELGYRSFYQGQMEKNKLLETFKEEYDSNLFGTDSFWEGVDAPGKTLRYVILTKLPFRMPSSPIEKAKEEELIKKGKSPFMDYTLPEAIIRFRQGFGRLIRTKNDYGVVAILDSRVLKKQYGKLFFRSLPRCKFFSGLQEDTIQSIKKHIKEWE